MFLYFYWLYYQACLVEELDNDKEDHITGVDPEKVGGEQDNSELKHQLTNHGGAEAQEDVSNVFWEDDVDGDGEVRELFYQLILCLGFYVF